MMILDRSERVGLPPHLWIGGAWRGARFGAGWHTVGTPFRNPTFMLRRRSKAAYHASALRPTLNVGHKGHIPRPDASYAGRSVGQSVGHPSMARLVGNLVYNFPRWFRATKKSHRYCKIFKIYDFQI